MAKSLQDIKHPDAAASDDNVDEIVDEMLLKAFRITTQEIRVMDALEDDRRARSSSPTLASKANC